MPGVYGRSATDDDGRWILRVGATYEIKIGTKLWPVYTSVRMLGVVHYVLGRFSGYWKGAFHGATEQFLSFIGAAMKMTMLQIQCP